MKKAGLNLLVLVILFFLSIQFAGSANAYSGCTWRHLTVTSGGTAAYSQSGGCENGEKAVSDKEESRCLGIKPESSSIFTSNGVTINTTYHCCCMADIKTEDPKFIMPDLKVTIPGLTLSPTSSLITSQDIEGNYNISVPWIAEYIKAAYDYGLGIAGILAALVLMAGGVLWLISGGDASKMGQAKEMIVGSVTGLVILACSYIILVQVNPELTKFKSIDIGTIKGMEIKNEISENMSSPLMQCMTSTYGSSAAEVEKNLNTVNFLGMDYRVHWKMAEALRKAQREITAAGINYKSTDPAGGGYNWRKNVNSPNEQSLHSFGIAIDINPGKNPNYKSTARPCKTDIPEQVRQILKNNGFRWGGDYKSVCDSMHFEWLTGNALCKVN